MPIPSRTCCVATSPISSTGRATTQRRPDRQLEGLGTLYRLGCPRPVRSEERSNEAARQSARRDQNHSTTTLWREHVQRPMNHPTIARPQGASPGRQSGNARQRSAEPPSSEKSQQNRAQQATDRHHTVHGIPAARCRAPSRTAPKASTTPKRSWLCSPNMGAPGLLGGP